MPRAAHALRRSPARALSFIEAEARRWRGENERGRVAATRAYELLDPGSPGWCEAASELALVDGALGDIAHLATLAETLRRVEPLGGSSQLINALARIARPLFWAGKHALASATLARGRELERTATGLQPTALASLYIAEGVEARLLGDPSECVRCNELAVKESARAGDLRSACAARGNLGYAYLEIGAYEDAERVLREAHATATRMRLPLVVATAEAESRPRARVAAQSRAEELAARTHASLAAFEERKALFVAPVAPSFISPSSSRRLRRTKRRLAPRREPSKCSHRSSHCLRARLP